MHKVVKYQFLKDHLKRMAEKIKTTRTSAQQEKAAGNGYAADRLRVSVKGTSNTYRHYHIAYCELRGKTREQIEKPHPNNLPNETFISGIKEEALKQYEAICAGQE